MMMAATRVVAINHSEKLYLLGDATPGGWALDKITAMNTVSNGIYTYTGTLGKGEMKFITSSDDWIPTYGPEIANTRLSAGTFPLTLRSSYDEPDNKFIVEAGTYTLRVDLNENLLTVTTADDNPGSNDITSNLDITLTTDKACYAPGETVTINCSVHDNSVVALNVRYRHLATVLADVPLTSATWTWLPPADDYKGYLAEVYEKETGTVRGVIAIDVSSQWTRFPRYGFVATFKPASVYGAAQAKSDELIEQEMAWLNRCHINGVQFQDWHYSHHHPCPPKNDDGSLWQCYEDIAMRWNSSDIVRKYIDVQHRYGMKSIFYNLAFGALDDAKVLPAATDGIGGKLNYGTYNYSGVAKEWYLYRGDSNGRYQPLQIDKHELPKNWKSDIYLVNPGNPDWINYMNLRNEEVYQNFDFDGFQIDQLGDRGWLFDNKGTHCYLPVKYADFIEGMYRQRPEKDLIMNSVSRYGAKEIMQTGKMAFAYNETWGDSGNDGYDDMYDIMSDNRKWGGEQMQTVFAAYMNYNKQSGYFNTPGVLLTDAVIFALGGGHLELGDHMLCHEYFPFEDVKMSSELKNAMVSYYDFHTAYENLLRDGGTEIRPEMSIVSGNASLAAWSAAGKWVPQCGKICRYAKRVGDQQVIHLLNFADANSTSWRDADGTMPEPMAMKNVRVSITVTDDVKSVWCATPDYHGGAVTVLPFERNGNMLTVTVPNLKYWTMLVLDNGIATEIRPQHVCDDIQTAAYGIDGRRISSAAKGIKIINGRKRL